MRYKNSWGFILVVVLMILLLWPGFGQVFLHPNGFLFADSGDGLKNYFNLGYYLKFDHGLKFSGVNYPFGEHLLYTDSHPLFAYLLNFVDDHLITLAPNSVGLINLAILLGMVICALVLFMILKHYHLPTMYAVIVAVCITFLSPQWDRLHGHLSLSYSFVIPLFWYFLLRYESTDRKNVWWFILFVYTAFLGGIHLYYVAICAIFLLAYLVILSTSKKKRKENWWKGHIKLAATVLLPLFLYLSISAITDTVDDRPIAPYGFFTYHATAASVFLPHYSSASQLLSRVFDLNLSWEGRAYVGFPSLCFLLGLMIYWWHQSRRQITVPFKMPEGIMPFLSAAVLVLLFSMCLPFKWGLQFLPDLITPLKQFRALGRFSWVFFYVVNICAAIGLYEMYKFLRERHANWISVTLMVVILGSWVFDAASFYLNHGPVSISKNEGLKNDSSDYVSRFNMLGQDYHVFQAILSSPLVAIRTDKMTFDKDLSAHNEAMKCAFYTGIPLIQSSASRPSLSQTLSSIQLISSPNIRKTRLQYMDTERPLLLIHSKAGMLTSQEKALLSTSQKFWENEFFEFLSLPISAFRDSIDELKSTNVAATSMERDDGELLCEPDCQAVFFDSFEDESLAPAVFFGKGARYQRKKELVLFDSTLNTLDSLAYEASFWVYIDPTFSGMPAWEYLSGQDPNHLESKGWQPTRDLSEVDGQWVRVSFPLRSGPHHKIVLHGKKSTADNLLIKPKETNVSIAAQGDLLFNNYILQHRK